jgi:hypothetical protein
MEGDGLEAEQFDEGGGEQMLGRVLLHVVEAARPVNLAVDWTWGDLGGGVVDYVVGVACARGVWRGGVRTRGVNNFYDLGIA